MPPARKERVTETTGCSWCSITTSCTPLASVASLNGGNRTGVRGVGLGGVVGKLWADMRSGRTAVSTAAAARLTALPRYRHPAVTAPPPPLRASPPSPPRSRDRGTLPRTGGYPPPSPPG